MSTAAGRQAEALAARFLQDEGHTLLGRNWRTRWCEIDIVAQKERIVYFVEVKYRARALWGNGLDYITAAKLRQMHFAAEVWLAAHAAQSVDYRIAALEVSGQPPAVTAWLDEI